jgi:hypothetical protein
VAGREERRKGGDRSRLEGKLEVVTQGGTLEVVIGGGFSLCEDREWEIDCELEDAYRECMLPNFKANFSRQTRKYREGGELCHIELCWWLLRPFPWTVKMLC